MLSSDIEIQVLTHPAKQCITAKFLGETITAPFALYENEDWELPIDHPEHREDRDRRPSMKGYAIRQFRAFRGHQEICKRASKPYTLVFEDDARANTTPAEWIKLVNNCLRFLHPPYNYDAVSLHGRELSRPYVKQVQLLGRNFVELPQSPVPGNAQQYFLRPARRWWPELNNPLSIRQMHGCLAYLINAEGRRIWGEAGHGGGMPCDLFLVNMINTIVCEQSPFDHMHELTGSLIDNTGACQRDLNDDGTEAMSDSGGCDAQD